MTNRLNFMKSKNTQAPWWYFDDSNLIADGRGPDVEADGGILKVAADVKGHTRKEAVANAMLMAAAPELKSALIHLLVASIRREATGTPSPNIYEIHRMAERAIKKAEEGYE